MNELRNTRGDEGRGVFRRIADAWSRSGARLFGIAVAISATAAAVRVAHGFWRLVSPADQRGGIDLRLRWFEVEAWFAGEQVYGRIGSAVYPPASYPMFWPFVGWTDRLTSRWIWAATTLVMLAWLAYLLWREHDRRPRIQRAWLALLPAAGYATHATLATGQVTLLVLALLTAGLLVITRARTLRSDLAGSALLVPALIKPTLSVPLLWIAFLVPGRFRPAAFIVAGYAALTLLAAAFQDAGPVALMRAWLDADTEVQLDATHTNLQRLLAGEAHVFLPIALALILATGAWVLRHRHVDVWVLMGVTALVARMLTYHRAFDDLLIVLPIVALYRIATRATLHRRVLAAFLAFACFAGMMAPRLLISDIEAAIRLLNSVLLPTVWIATLLFLILEARSLRLVSGPAHPLAPLSVPRG